MKKLGIIGAENSHSHNIAKLCNIDKSVRLRATHIWGETRADAESSAAQGGIPNIVDDWREMAGQVDAVMIDHRHGADHVEVAEYFIRHGTRVFVDKPMTVSLASANRLFSLAARKQVPICTFSLIPLQQAFRKFCAEVAQAGPAKAMNTSGPVDLDSPHGGIFFYGMHQIDALVEIMGTEAVSARLDRHGKNGVAMIFFSGDRIATMNCLAEGGVFHWRVSTDNAVHVLPHQPDEVVYLASVKVLEKFAAKGTVPWTRERMLAPIAILEALQTSLDERRTVKVKKLA